MALSREETDELGRLEGSEKIRATFPNDLSSSEKLRKAQLIEKRDGRNFPIVDESYDRYGEKNK